MRVCVVTGTRAEYGLLKPFMGIVSTMPEWELQVIATGMHLSPEYGLTVRQIETDGFRVSARVDMLFSNDTASAMAKGVGVGILGIAQALESLNPDYVVVLGDRTEAFAAAVAASLSNIMVAHIHGGDRSTGGLDEPMRHAITRLAHVHFAATKESAERLERMGEEPRRIFIVGAPGLDGLAEDASLSKNELEQRLGLDFGKPVATVVQHPVSTSPDQAAAQITETLQAMVGLGLQTVVVCPNSDAGGRAMAAVIRGYQSSPDFRIVQTLPRREYLSLVRYSSVLVGNSSSGVIEAPYLGTPVVNVGERQVGRETATTILQAGYDRREIGTQVRRALHDKEYRALLQSVTGTYGDGQASRRMVECLQLLGTDSGLRQKTLTY